MKKLLIFISILFSVIAAFYVGRFYELLQDTTSISDVVDQADTTPTTSNSQANENEDVTPDESSTANATSPPQSELTLFGIKAGDSVQSPLIITGEVTGGWFFEGSATMEVQDMAGHILGRTITTAATDWLDLSLAGAAVPFTAEVHFAEDVATEGFLVFHNANPSGLPEHDQTIRIPVTFSPSAQPASLQLDNIHAGMLLESPMTIRGSAVGWYHEGEFTATVRDDAGNVLTIVVLTAEDDWMSYEFVPFSGDVQFEKPESDTGTLTFTKANPGSDSGQGTTEAYQVSVRFYE